MTRRIHLLVLGVALAGGMAGSAPVFAGDGTLHLRLPDRVPGTSAEPEKPTEPPVDVGRRGFDYQAFTASFEDRWFQRTLYLNNGQEQEAQRQSDLLRAFLQEQGIRRMVPPAAALVIEAARFMEQGSYEKARESVELASAFAPGWHRIHVARAALLWRSGGGALAAAQEYLAGLRAAVAEEWRGLALFDHLPVLFCLALLGCLAVFSLSAVLRHQVAVRHGVAEFLRARGAGTWAYAAGWAVVLAPFLSWVGAGWAPFYWIALTFRHMRRGERVAAASLLALTVAVVPGYRVAVAVYGMTSDPVVRTTLAAASGDYQPDQIVRVQQLMEAHPQDPAYRFLLAGLYKNGRFFEEAYEEYRQALSLDPRMYQAQINIGNIFFQMGQYPEAIAWYRRALETRPDSLLAYYDTYLAQTESFRLREAEQTLRRARDLDAAAIAELTSRGGAQGDRKVALDAALDLGSIWEAALEGRQAPTAGPAGGAGWKSVLREVPNPLSLVSLLTLLTSITLVVVLRKFRPAQRCVRCGRPFCHRCKSGREGQEYCSQCVHLFVLGDGLAPETKTRKLYDIERFERRSRLARWIASALLPGTGQVLQGRWLRGSLLLFLWLAALLTWMPGSAAPVEWLTGLHLNLDLLRPRGVPEDFALNPSAIVGMLAAMTVWLAANFSRLRLRRA